MEWYFTVLRKYAVFSGRARRKEYWIYNLINSIVISILAVSEGFTSRFDTGYGIGMLTSIYILGVMIPSIAVTVRRLHDTGRSGLWYFVGLIPVIGWLAVLIFTLLDSEFGSNEYGDNPKELND